MRTKALERPCQVGLERHTDRATRCRDAEENAGAACPVGAPREEHVDPLLGDFPELSLRHRVVERNVWVFEEPEERVATSSIVSDGLRQGLRRKQRRRDQHDRSTSTARRRVAAETSSPNSSRGPSRSRTWSAPNERASSDAVAHLGTSSTSVSAAGGSSPTARRRPRLIRQVLSERASTPFSRAQSRGVRPARSAAAKQRRASSSSSIFRVERMQSSSTRGGTPTAGVRVIPASLMAHLVSLNPTG